MTTPSKPAQKSATAKKAAAKPAAAKAEPTTKAPHVGQVVTYDAPGDYGGEITGHGVIVALEKTDDGQQKIARVAAFTDVRAVPVDSLQAAD